MLIYLIEYVKDRNIMFRYEEIEDYEILDW